MPQLFEGQVHECLVANNYTRKWHQWIL